MRNRYDLNGGMTSVLPPELMPERTAALIRNMRLTADGTWTAVPALAVVAEATAFEIADKIEQWEPVYVPTGCIDPYIFIAFDSSAAYAIYRTESGWTRATIIDGVQGDQVRWAHDSTQFLFCDGRAHLPTQRIIIDDTGTITCLPLGVHAPSIAPEITRVDVSTTSDEEYTQIPSGVTLFYCFCAVNKWGERSNPSPMSMYNWHHRFLRGEYLLDDYIYSDEHTGEIVNVQVRCEIDNPDVVTRIELYRSITQYTEAPEGRDQMMLVRSVPTNGDSVVTITDTNPTTTLPVDTENDVAPAGDDITISQGLIAIANAVSTSTFPNPVTNVWKITLTNLNPVNYTDAWIRVALHDETIGALLVEPYLDGITSWATLPAGDYNKLRFLDEDRKTGLEAYKCTDAYTSVTDCVTSQNIAGSSLFLLRIPYIPAQMDKIIYLVQEESAVALPIPVLDADDDYMEGMLDNPVRNSHVAYSALSRSADQICLYNPGGPNQANGYNDWAIGEISVNPVYEERHFDGRVFHTMQTRNGILRAPGVTSKILDLDLEGVHALTGGGYAYVTIYYPYTSLPANDRPNMVMELKAGNSKIQIMYWKGSAVAHCIARLEIGDEREYCAASVQAAPAFGDYAWLYVSWDRPTQTGVSLCAAIVQTQISGPPVQHNLFAYSTTKYWSTGDAELSSDTDIRLSLIHNVAVHETGSANSLSSPTSDYANDAESPPYDIEAFIGPYVAFGDYVTDPYEIYALHLWEPRFPTEAIGYRGTTKLSGATYYPINANVAIEVMSVENENAPGRIRWSRGASVPELNERNVYDEIIRIVASRSIMPTEEHNTLLVFTANGKLSRCLLSNDAVDPITEMENVPLSGPDALQVMKDRIIWNTTTEIYSYSSAGIQNISAYRVPAGTYKLVANPSEGEVLFIPESGAANILVYNITNDTWSERDYTIRPIAYALIDDEIHIVDESGDLYNYGATTLPTEIWTRGYPAEARIRRITIRGQVGDTYTIQARVHHFRQDSGSEDTPTYTGYGNKPIAIANLTGQLVQFYIAGLEKLKYIDIEDASNGNALG